MFSKRRATKSKKKGTKDEKAKGLPPSALPAAGARKASFGLEEKLLHLWRTPITQLPVYKDIPRLIRRIEVVVNEPEVVGSPRQSTAPQETEVRTEVFEVWLNTNLPEDDDRFRARAWSEQWRTVTLSIALEDRPTRTSHIPFVDVREDGRLLYSVPISQVFTVSDSTRYFVIQSLTGGTEGYAGVAFNMRTDSTAFLSALEEYGRKREELQQSLGTITAPPSVDKATLRFLNNVGVSQRDLRDPEMANILFQSTEHFLKDAEKKAPEEMELSQLEVIQQVIVKVAQHMEDKAKLKQIQEGLEEMVRANYTGDMELSMSSLFAESIGQDSKTARVFKMINQSVIFIPIIILKTEITKSHVMTKDDTSPDGWKIRIVIEPDTVTITHSRRELPLVSVKPDEKQFWFKWELVMVFDRKMNDMLSSSLKVTELHFDEGLNPALRETLRTILNNGNMVIE